MSIKGVQRLLELVAWEYIQPGPVARAVMRSTHGAGAPHAFCESRIPPHVRGEIRLTFSFWKESVILYEERPHWQEPGVWTKMKIARIDFDEASRGWTLWAYDRNDRPVIYIDLDTNVSLDDVLREIDADPTGIFWG